MPYHWIIALNILVRINYTASMEYHVLWLYGKISPSSNPKIFDIAIFSIDLTVKFFCMKTIHMFKPWPCF